MGIDLRGWGSVTGRESLCGGLGGAEISRREPYPEQPLLPLTDWKKYGSLPEKPVKVDLAPHKVDLGPAFNGLSADMQTAMADFRGGLIDIVAKFEGAPREEIKQMFDDAEKKRTAAATAPGLK